MRWGGRGEDVSGTHNESLCTETRAERRRKKTIPTPRRKRKKNFVPAEQGERARRRTRPPGQLHGLDTGAQFGVRVPAGRLLATQSKDTGLLAVAALNGGQQLLLRVRPCRLLLQGRGTPSDIVGRCHVPNCLGRINQQGGDGRSNWRLARWRLAPHGPKFLNVAMDNLVDNGEVVVREQL